MISPDLRPLGIGEVLDRAVTLFVRHFSVIVLILAVIAVPVAIVQYASSPSTEGFLGELQRLLAVPPGHDAERSRILREISATNRIGAVAGLVIFASAILETLSVTACMIAVAQVSAGRMPSVREVYREALKRWIPQLIALVAFVGLAFVVVIVIFLVAVLAALAIAALAAVSRIGAIVVGIPVAIVIVPAYVLSIVCTYFAAQMSTVSIAIEDPNPIRGIAAGLRRTLTPTVFWRSALVGTIVFGVSLIGTVVLLSIGSLLGELTHLSALTTVVSVIGGVVLNGLLTTFLVVYAIDVRVRREGYDLELAARETTV